MQNTDFLPRKAPKSRRSNSSGIQKKVASLRRLRNINNFIRSRSVENHCLVGAEHDSLKHIYASKKEKQKQALSVNGLQLTLSPGKHNKLQKAIIEDFAPRFAPNAKCLYVGDTTEKDLVKDVETLKKLGFAITLHDKMPDVVFYDEEKNWLFFVEAVTSVGPMDPKRIVELGDLTKKVKAGKIFVTAFLDFATYKKFAADLAWDTEVWIAEMPEHMIHLNGDRFLGPRG